MGKWILSGLGVLIISGTFMSLGASSSSNTVVEPVTFVPQPQPTISLSTPVWGIFESDGGEIIVGNNTDVSRPIASITKLFTAYATMQSEEVDSLVQILFTDVATEGRAGNLTSGDILSRRELLFPLLIESSNDAAVALKRSLDNSYTMSLARVYETLALTGTRIVEPSGLAAENISTISDLARFSSYVRTHEPYLFNITQLHTYVGREISWKNNSPFVSLASYRGGKHGYTDEAGRTFIGFFYIPSLDRDIGVALLGSTNLRQDVADVLDFFETHHEHFF